jgi:hypothetical protein
MSPVLLRLRGACACGAVALVAAPAGAVVTQVNGLVVPTYNAGTCPGAADQCLQTGLNIGEGFAPNAGNNPLDQIFDAALAPEVFQIPKESGVYRVVEFDDLQEGAGYENTFGWYNVGQPGVLYDVIPCGDEPASAIRTVDFEAEFQAGRYLGGFVGFFMISPGLPTGGGGGCGSQSNVGFVVYTESALNGDGNYVHYLIYESKADPLVYYFGFEDLWRGGDNDFDDMAIKVRGLQKPCVPSAEICNGLDDNCDGLIDNDPVDAGGPCGTTDVGVCEFGTEVCQNGSLVCVGAIGPSSEICNKLDDDCNGTVDDNPIDVGGTCGTDVGECELGQQQCIGGVVVCVGGKGPSLEICNLKDDDCDGAVDDDTIDTGGPCGSNVGECTPGTLECVSGQVDCVGGTAPVPEICNGLDDDCDGLIDDGDPGGGAACGSDVGVCDPGVEHCVDGQIECVGGRGPSAEICDGLDNDCDGVGDQGVECPAGSVCIEGTCAPPCGGGEFPCPGGQVCRNGYCVPDDCEGVSCDDGEACVQGICIPADAGASGGAAGTAGTAGAAATSSGGSGAAAPAGRAQPENWGLATGGGGMACSAGGSAGGAAWLLVLAASSALRRRRR